MGTNKNIILTGSPVAVIAAATSIMIGIMNRLAFSNLRPVTILSTGRKKPAAASSNVTPVAKSMKIKKSI